MRMSSKVLVAVQCFPPDESTTSVYVATIAEAFATDNDVLVISATNSSRYNADIPGRPEIIELRNWNPAKSALAKRTIAICVLAVRMFVSVLKRARSSDIVFCVTSPSFTLPYAIILAAKLRGAATILLIYDLYPEALEAAGFIKSTSITARLLRFANRLMFSASDSIVVIGRDVIPLLTRYPGVTASKIHFIPNWTLLPIGYRDFMPHSRFRASLSSKFIVGLSGNLGFTHSPSTVFEAARLLKEEQGIHFILSGWGVGWKKLNDLVRAEPLENVSMIDPVPQDELVEFLSAADVWVIPYRRNTAGVSIPSRLYNLLAVGRPIIVGTERHSEAAIEFAQEAIGWIVPPEDPIELARAIREAANDHSATIRKGQQAAVVALKYSQEAAMLRYREIIGELKTRKNGPKSRSIS
jgi:colanic acid biosynthesis glycosyl transferase WcaI